ncbi:glycosyltransferase [Occultella kanbiaonis]|uniref:glycosyltransferase n=1 Tax=Occultella kanbiaonis TaxID=2675754 RepID=UPI001E64E719|nr:glycosyltransferase [Occultella kanbiaonis]
MTGRTGRGRVAGDGRRVVAFGTYDARSHPRVQVLIDGLRAHGAHLMELNAPLGLNTADRVRLLNQPWRLPTLAWRLAARWSELVRGSIRIRRAGGVPDAVLVGYLGHFDVLLARILFPRTTILLDHLIFAGSTASDRGVQDGLRVRLLRLLDRLAISAADVVIVDTQEHLEMVPASRRARAVVVPVGASRTWFDARADADRATAGEVASGTAERDGLGVVFFGLYTPLQGAPVIAEAIRDLPEAGLRFTMIGTGQDFERARTLVGDDPRVTWRDWVDADDLPALVASHDVCLGVFGTSTKALSVVPNKVYQGAAAGVAIVTSDSAPQRRMLGEAALLVPPGDAPALAAAIRLLASNGDRLARYRGAARDLADDRFTAAAVTAPLAGALGTE